MEERVTLEAKRTLQDAVLEAAERCITYLKEHYGVKRAIIFGSARGESPWHEGSDLDLAVEGLAPEVFFRALSELYQLLPRGIMLDLLPLEDVSPELRLRILEGVEMSEDHILNLKRLVEDELRTLERVVGRMQDALKGLSEPPTQLELRGLASYIHDFYTGIEGIFERIAVQIDGSFPKSAQWHMDLLNQMAEERENIRPAVIDEKLWALLKDYLNFRHFFRHAYGFTLQWTRMRPLADEMRKTFESLQTQLTSWFEKIQAEE